jgi:hypothetical protein
MDPFPIFLNTHLAAFDRDWNLIEDVAVTDFSPTNRHEAGRPGLHLFNKRLYVSYDVTTITADNKELFDGQAYVSVYQLSDGGLPGAATLLSPSDNIHTSVPTYTWNAVATATSYRHWVNDPTAAPKIQQWYTAEQAGCASGTGACTLTPAVALAPGVCQWWIQTWNDSGYGPWSNGMAFTVSTGDAPGKATLLFPFGRIAMTNPTYAWNAVPNATWYQLWVDDSSGSPKIKSWYTATQARCASGTGNCSIEALTPLSPGPCQWWIQTWNTSGYGPWSDAMPFIVEVNSIKSRR